MAKRKGIAIVNVLIFAVFTTVFLITGVSFTTAAMRQGRQTTSNVQVYNVALAGISHAVFWLQKQSVQPVLIFDPRENGTAAPDEEPETRDEELGLMGEFAIDSGKKLYGRYEVARSAAAPARAPEVPNPGPSSDIYDATPITWTAEDISAAKGDLDKPGSIWHVRCRAYTFTRNSPADAFNLDGTNDVKILETLTLEADVKSAALKFRDAALYGYGTGLSGWDAEFKESSGTKPRVEVGDATSSVRGCLLRTDNVDGYSSELEVADSGAASGYNESGISTSLGDQLTFIFGVSSLGEVKNMAEAAYEAMADVPDDLGAMTFVYLTGNYTFNGSKPLAGGGILFVDGDLTLDGNSAAQSWEGLIFTTGKFTMKKESTVTGAVVAGGNIKLEASSGKQPKISYSGSQLQLVADTLGSYRMERSTLRTVPEAATSNYIF